MSMMMVMITAMIMIISYNDKNNNHDVDNNNDSICHDQQNNNNDNSNSNNSYSFHRNDLKMWPILVLLWTMTRRRLKQFPEPFKISRRPTRLRHELCMIFLESQKGRQRTYTSEFEYSGEVN